MLPVTFTRVPAPATVMPRLLEVDHRVARTVADEPSSTSMPVRKPQGPIVLEPVGRIRLPWTSAPRLPPVTRIAVPTGLQAPRGADADPEAR